MSSMPAGIHHLLEPDVNQEVYGLPEYLGALRAAWLNESALSAPLL
jgi:capsid portal protein